MVDIGVRILIALAFPAVLLICYPILYFYCISKQRAVLVEFAHQAIDGDDYDKTQD